MPEQQRVEKAHHIAEAERLLLLADSPAGAALLADGYNALAAAQVHATLALALTSPPAFSTPEEGSHG